MSSEPPGAIRRKRDRILLPSHDPRGANRQGARLQNAAPSWTNPHTLHAPCGNDRGATSSATTGSSTELQASARCARWWTALFQEGFAAVEERARHLQSGPRNACVICVEPHAVRAAFPCCENTRCVTRTAMVCAIKYLVQVAQQQAHRPRSASSCPEPRARIKRATETAPRADHPWPARSEPAAGREDLADHTLSTLIGAGVLLGSEGFVSGLCERPARARSYASLCDTSTDKEEGDVDTENFDNSTDDLHLDDAGTLAEEIDAAFLVASRDSQ